MHFRSSNCMKYTTQTKTLQQDFNHDHAVTAAHPLLAGLGFSWSSGFRSYLLGKAVKNLMKRPKLRPKVQEIVKRFHRFLAKQLAAILGMTAFFISASTKLEVVGVNLFEPLAAGNVPQSARVSHTKWQQKAHESIIPRNKIWQLPWLLFPHDLTPLACRHQLPVGIFVTKSQFWNVTGAGVVFAPPWVATPWLFQKQSPLLEW